MIDSLVGSKPRGVSGSCGPVTVSVWIEGSNPRRGGSALRSVVEAAARIGGALIEGPSVANGETFSGFSFPDRARAVEFLDAVSLRNRISAMLDDEERIAARLAARRRVL